MMLLQECERLAPGLPPNMMNEIVFGPQLIEDIQWMEENIPESDSIILFTLGLFFRQHSNRKKHVSMLVRQPLVVFEPRDVSMLYQKYIDVLGRQKPWDYERKMFHIACKIVTLSQNVSQAEIDQAITLGKGVQSLSSPDMVKMGKVLDRAGDQKEAQSWFEKAIDGAEKVENERVKEKALEWLSRTLMASEEKEDQQKGALMGLRYLQILSVRKRKEFPHPRTSAAADLLDQVTRHICEEEK